ncbi:hypothetical protein [Arthrobacter pigmenti]
MQNLLVFLATAEPSPGEDLREGLDPEMVTPGTLGFLATLFVVIAVIFLIRDMTKRIRRVRYREQVQMEADGQGDDDGEGTDGEGDDDGQGDDDGEGGGTDKANDTSDGAARRLKDSNGAGPDRKG